MAKAAFSADKRLIERQIKDGKLTREQYAAFLDGLPDASTKAAKLTEGNDDRNEAADRASES